MGIGDRIKLPLSLDLEKMRAEVRGLPLHAYIEYSVLPLTAPRALPRSTPITDYADGSWAEWLDTPLLGACPYLESVVNDFRSHTTVTLVRLLRLAPGGIVKEHTDPPLWVSNRSGLSSASPSRSSRTPALCSSSTKSLYL